MNYIIPIIGIMMVEKFLSTKKIVFLMDYKINLNIYLTIYAELFYSKGSF